MSALSFSRAQASADEDALSLRFLHRPIVFTEPERAVHPPSWLDNTPFAFWIVDALRPSVFVELGSHSGNSYASFAQAVQMLGLPTACYSVDTWRGDPQAGFYAEQVFEDWSAYHDRRFSTFSRLIRATFDEAVGHFSDGSIDLLHIDGYHTFDAVSHDFEAWRPKMSTRGVVLCHDIDVRENDFGAWKLWERLRDEYPCFEFRHGHGLGVVGVGSDLPEAVRWLLSLRTRHAETTNTVCQFFSRLGAAVLGRYTAEEARRTLRAELAAREDTLRTERAAREESLAQTLHDTAVKTAEEAKATHDAEFERLASEIASLRARLRTVSSDVEKRDERLVRAGVTITRLGAELGGAERRAEAARGDVRQLKRAIRTAEQALEARLAEAERLAAQVKTAGNTARQLDGEALAMLDRLRIERQHREEETARRMDAEACLSWSRRQIARLAAERQQAPAPGRTKAVSRGLAIALRMAGRAPRSLTKVIEMIAATPGRLRDLETIAASRLFDEAFYLGRNPDVAASGVPALLHYVMAGAAEGRDPHPLFSTPFYVSQVPGLDVRDRNPLHHYLTQGWWAGYAPHPLFDPQHYLAQHEDAAEADVDPLTHYLAHGATARLNPHKRFDVDFYLREHQDVHEAGVEPLTHFVVAGSDEGRRAHPPSDVETRERSERWSGTRIELTARSLVPRRRDAEPTILVVSHVGPWRPRAGNEYRVQRMLRWYQRQGYRVIPLIAPLPGEDLPREGIDAIAAEFGHVIQVHRDGRIDYVLRDFPEALASLDGSFTSPFADLLAEEEAGVSHRERELLNIERTFCHDAVISTVLHLQRALGPHILQVEYIWMTRLLPLVRGQVLKVVDTHDVFSSIAHKVRLFGVRDVNIEPHEEAARLRRADLAIAIQDDERAELEELAPSLPIVTAGVDFDVVHEVRTPSPGRILYVASNNARNRKGLEDFVRLAWPRIHQRVPHAELLVAGSVSKAMAGRDVTGVRVLGLVEDLTARYLEAALVINPVVAGTGLKIKMLEALCHFRPLVTWPAGIDGLDPALAALCYVATDWYAFSEEVIRALTTRAHHGFTAEERATIARLVAPEHVYAPLDAAFRDYSDDPWRASAMTGTSREQTRRASVFPMVVNAND